jgi:predicted nucleic acid-binding protein
MTTVKAASEISSLRRFFRLLPGTQAVLDTWQRMVIDLGVSGKSAHDTHLAAVMQVYSVTKILTFNGADFRRFPCITVIDPAQV